MLPGVQQLFDDRRVHPFVGVAAGTTADPIEGASAGRTANAVITRRRAMR